MKNLMRSSILLTLKWYLHKTRIFCCTTQNSGARHKILSYNTHIKVYISSILSYKNCVAQHENLCRMKQNYVTDLKAWRDSSLLQSQEAFPDIWVSCKQTLRPGGIRAYYNLKGPFLKFVFCVNKPLGLAGFEPITISKGLSWNSCFV
jgi:hypothetical protein